MSEPVTVSIGERLHGFIQAKVREGRYDSPSDVVSAGLRLLEEREAGLAALRAALIEGEESGVSNRNVLDIWADIEQQSGSMGG